MKNWLNKGTVLALSLMLLITSSACGEEFRYDFHKSIEIKKPVFVNLELVKGKVAVVGTDDEHVVIEATKIVRASSIDEADELSAHIEIKVLEDGDKIVVMTNYLDLLDRKPSFWQKILGGGSEVISEVAYKISLPFKSGISIKGMDADVELLNVESPVFIEKSTGRIKGEFIIGAVNITQPMGQIDLQWVEGDISISSQSSAITIRQTRGAIKLSSYNGNVDIQTELDSATEYLVETTTGNINFAVPFTAAGSLELACETGQFSSQIPVEINSMVRNRITGTFGGGGTKVRLNSNSGSVVLAQF